MVLVVSLIVAVFALSAVNASFNINTDNAGVAILNGLVTGASIAQYNSIFTVRISYALTNAWFDAFSAFNDKTIGLRYRPEKLKKEKWTLANKNAVIIYASFPILESTLGLTRANAVVKDLFPVGYVSDPEVEIVGKAAGAALVQYLISDASNQLGKLGGNQFNLNPYREYIGYIPKNDAYTVTDPRYWQPNFFADGQGVFYSQQHVATGVALIPGISIINTEKLYKSPASTARASSLADFKARIKPLLEDILDKSAKLNDKTKLLAEFYNDKGKSFVPALAYLNVLAAGDIDIFVAAAFTGALAAYDTAIVIWKNKIFWNSVRPITAIRYFYGDEKVLAWAGPKQGTKLIAGNDFNSYVRTAPHTDYPSGSAGYDCAFAAAEKAFWGNDQFGFSFSYAVGSSAVEAGLTPAIATNITVATFSQYANDVGDARVYAGVHFREDVDEAKRIADIVGPFSNSFVQKLLKGKVPNPYSTGEAIDQDLIDLGLNKPGVTNSLTTLRH